MMRYGMAAVAAGLVSVSGAAEPGPPQGASAEMSRDALLDRVYGGWVGMLIGGLEGLPHEMKYIDEPRAELPEFSFLPDGACSDDDNDFEWPHVYFMDRDGVLKLPYPRIVEIWKANMNRGIWVANKRARELMDEGVVPPDTGDPERNPAARYNLSGQFCTEAYGMIAPGMPQAAADIGLHYARIAVSGEPLEATRFWTSLISLAGMRQGEPDELIAAAAGAVGPDSAMAEVVADVRAWHREMPDDWKGARARAHAKWMVERGWNRNATPTNGAIVLLGLLYGGGDFYRTLQLTMAMGYDADCNAATAGAVLGCRLGFRHIAALPQYRMPDRYENRTRPWLPAECPVSMQAETLLRVAERVILENGGTPVTTAEGPGYRIRLQDPARPETAGADPGGVDP